MPSHPFPQILPLNYLSGRNGLELVTPEWYSDENRFRGNDTG